MARRSSVTRRARRDKIRDQEKSNDASVNRSFDELVQHLNVIDTKSRVIRETTTRMPFNHAVLGSSIIVSFIGFFFVLGGILGAIIYGTLISGAAAQIFGPTGGLERRAKSKKDVIAAREKAISAARALPEDVDVIVFGLLKPKQENFTMTSKPEVITLGILGNLDEFGRFDLGDYRLLGIARRTAEGKFDLKHDAIRNLTWLVQSRNKGISDDQILSALGA